MKKFLTCFVATQDDIGVFIARIILSVVMLPHGAQKILGWFGGYGFHNTMAYFTSTGMPAVIAFLVIMAESLGALALLVGLFGRFMAFAIGLNMLGAILMVHLKIGFFMNWAGAQKGEGFEFHLLALALVLILVIKGSGKFSLDRMLHKRLLKK